VEANPAYELALRLHSEACRISRIRLHRFTNLTLSSRFREAQRVRIGGIPVERHIWDLKRLAALYESGREREAVHIDCEESGFAPLLMHFAITSVKRSMVCMRALASPQNA
jgi:hypothetical protein